MNILKEVELALSKANIMAPIYDKEEKLWVCPRCGIMEEFEYKYCPWCGQKMRERYGITVEKEVI